MRVIVSRGIWTTIDGCLCFTQKSTTVVNQIVQRNKQETADNSSVAKRQVMATVQSFPTRSMARAASSAPTPPAVKKATVLLSDGFFINSKPGLFI
jgi:hypothetical protein